MLYNVTAKHSRGKAFAVFTDLLSYHEGLPVYVLHASGTYSLFLLNVASLRNFSSERCLSCNCETFPLGMFYRITVKLFPLECFTV